MTLPPGWVQDESSDLWLPGTAIDIGGYESWLSQTFPDTFTAPLAPQHHDAWAWLWAIRYETPIDPGTLALLLARGGGKSTTTETGVIALGRRRARRFVLYVSGTQTQANQHVNEIRKKLADQRLKEQDPDLSNAAVTEYGVKEGWSGTGQARLHTAAGFYIYAYGLDSALRGLKVGDFRPDLIVFDDIDARHDTLASTDKKIEIITESVLPAGAPWAASLFVQNIIHADSIAAQLADGRADFLRPRRVSGPHPAVRGLVVARVDSSAGAGVTVDSPAPPPAAGGLASAAREYGVPDPPLVRDTPSQDSFGSAAPKDSESSTIHAAIWKIVAGTPTWAGQTLATCEQQINQWRLQSFLREAQHEVEETEGGVFEHVVFEHCNPDAVPPLTMTVVAVDPAVTDTDRSDANGICVAGVASDKTVYFLWSYEQRSEPLATMLLAMRKCIEYRAAYLVVETVQGGKTWDTVFKEAIRILRQAAAWPKDYREPQFLSERGGVAQQNKTERGLRLLTDYESGRIIHVTDKEGTWQTLEKGLRRAFIRKPFDVADTAFWVWWTLRRRFPIDRSAHRIPVRRHPPTERRKW